MKSSQSPKIGCKTQTDQQMYSPAPWDVCMLQANAWRNVLCDWFVDIYWYQTQFTWKFFPQIFSTMNQIIHKHIHSGRYLQQPVVAEEVKLRSIDLAIPGVSLQFH